VSPVGATRPLVAELLGEKQKRPPIWIMRQAGRYLPEYRQVREGVGSFLELCYTPALAAEVTLQPIRRFDLDAAILFSDILVIPDALGQRVEFEPGEGPILGPLDIGSLDPARVLGKLAPVMETVDRVRSALPADKALIGFCGGPWTVATYMIGGRGSPDQAAARLFALREPVAFAALIDILVEASGAYLLAQVRAGADVVQIFESWAGNLDDAQFRERVIEPNRRIVSSLRRQAPANLIVTGFPRGAGPQISAYAKDTGVDCIGLDTTMPPGYADSALPKSLPVQGNLDPLRLVAGGAQMEDAARGIIAAFQNRPHVFNLGHGIVPETPIAHVEQLVKIVREI
jgi:uroporphyrinogen decarboxylase